MKFPSFYSNFIQCLYSKYASWSLSSQNKLYRGMKILRFYKHYHHDFLSIFQQYKYIWLHLNISPKNDMIFVSHATYASDAMQCVPRERDCEIVGLCIPARVGLYEWAGEREGEKDMWVSNTCNQFSLLASGHWEDGNALRMACHCHSALSVFDQSLPRCVNSLSWGQDITRDRWLCFWLGFVLEICIRLVFYVWLIPRTVFHNWAVASLKYQRNLSSCSSGLEAGSHRRVSNKYIFQSVALFYLCTFI